MAYKPLWDWMDKHEGRKGSSFEAMKKEVALQGGGKRDKAIGKIIHDGNLKDKKAGKHVKIREIAGKMSLKKLAGTEFYGSHHEDLEMQKKLKRYGIRTE